MGDRERRAAARGVVDFDAMLRPNDQVLAYAAVALIVEQPTDALLWFGSDEAAKVFLNGDEVFARDASRHFRPDQDAVGLRLREGPNLLVFKVCDEEGAFEFAARLRAVDGSTLVGVTESDEPETLLAALREQLPDTMVPDMLERVEQIPRTYSGKIKRS